MLNLPSKVTNSTWWDCRCPPKPNSDLFPAPFVTRLSLWTVGNILMPASYANLSHLIPRKERWCLKQCVRLASILQVFPHCFSFPHFSLTLVLTFVPLSIYRQNLFRLFSSPCPFNSLITRLPFLMLLFNAKRSLTSFHLLFVYTAYQIKLCFCFVLCAIMPSICDKSYLIDDFYLSN